MICQHCWKPYNSLTGRHYHNDSNICDDLHSILYAKQIQDNKKQ